MQQQRNTRFDGDLKGPMSTLASGTSVEVFYVTQLCPDFGRIAIGKTPKLALRPAEGRLEGRFCRFPGSSPAKIRRGRHNTEYMFREYGAHFYSSAKLALRLAEGRLEGRLWCFPGSSPAKIRPGRHNIEFMFLEYGAPFYSRSQARGLTEISKDSCRL